jgi:hypothetical protein
MLQELHTRLPIIKEGVKLLAIFALVFLFSTAPYIFGIRALNFIIEKRTIEPLNAVHSPEKSAGHLPDAHGSAWSRPRMPWRCPHG